jgi:ATP synthase protein I
MASEIASTARSNIGLRQALAVVAGQVLLGTVVALICLVASGPHAAVSALLGAGIGIAATALMAWATVRPGVGTSAVRLLFGFFTGWLVKVGLTVALLIVALQSKRVDAVPLIAAYIATFFGYWFGAARMQ